VRTLAQWLEFIERQHPKTIALGLDRASAVWQRMRVRIGCPVITVAGKNDKWYT
jgi:dihydrofolate synthase/folylpolyglutamate synthase